MPKRKSSKSSCPNPTIHQSNKLLTISSAKMPLIPVSYRPINQFKLFSQQSRNSPPFKHVGCTSSLVIGKSSPFSSFESLSPQNRELFFFLFDALFQFGSLLLLQKIDFYKFLRSGSFDAFAPKFFYCIKNYVNISVYFNRTSSRSFPEHFFLFNRFCYQSCKSLAS